jgi:hypothetical protein
LGNTLDSEQIEANYEGGVLTVVIPVAEQAKPRRIEVSVGSDNKQLSASTVSRPARSHRETSVPVVPIERVGRLTVQVRHFECVGLRKLDRQ